MTPLQSIQKAIDYIDANPADKLDLTTISSVAGFSLSHFHKLFLAATGFTIKTYIRNKRLSYAARELVTTRRGILDIALEAGFESQEAFSRAFVRLYGIPPAQYRRDRKEIIKYDKHAGFVKGLGGNQSDQPGIYIEGKLIEGEPMYLAGTELYTSVAATIEDDIIPRFWRDVFIPWIPEIKNLKTPHLSIGYEVHNPETDVLYHLAAVEVNGPRVPEELKLKVLEPCRYAVFTPERPLKPTEYGQLVLYAYGEWLPMKGLQLAGDYTMDFNYSDQYYSGYRAENSRLEVYIPVI